MMFLHDYRLVCVASTVRTLNPYHNLEPRNFDTFFAEYPFYRIILPRWAGRFLKILTAVRTRNLIRLPLSYV